ncbi:hypothetical protein [Flavobacterium facile]|uniref:hypothetical protein n=1 Tax=Flavobacterium facile TaxID=2893174 RepID=UPI002E77D37E|nr:hypothetical protein [Flavobacterium sp. T-12]
MKDLKNLYLELEKRISDNIVEIKTIDLWSEQVSFMAEEHPFKSPAVFFGFRTLEQNNMSEKVQNLTMQVDTYLFYETFADTSKGSKKQEKALGFLDLLTKINACLHGSSGLYFHEMKRTGFNPVETGGAGILYVQRYQFTMIDDSAQILYENLKFDNMEIEVIREEIPAKEIIVGVYSPITTD